MLAWAVVPHIVRSSGASCLKVTCHTPEGTINDYFRIEGARSDRARAFVQRLIAETFGGSPGIATVAEALADSVR